MKLLTKSFKIMCTKKETYPHEQILKEDRMLTLTDVALPYCLSLSLLVFLCCSYFYIIQFQKCDDFIFHFMRPVKNKTTIISQRLLVPNSFLVYF